MLAISFTPSQSPYLGACCGCGFGGLGGALTYGAGDSGKKLQNLLKQLATAKQNPTFDPGEYTGTVTIQTVAALFNVATKIKVDLPVIGQVLSAIQGIIKFAEGLWVVGPIVKKLIDQVLGNPRAAGAIVKLINEQSSSVGSKIGDVVELVGKNAGTIATVAGPIILAAIASSVPQPPTQVNVPSGQSGSSQLYQVSPQLTPPAPVAPAVATYPPGTVYAWSPALQAYRIAVPATGAVAGLGVMDACGSCIFGDCGLGQADMFNEVAPTKTPPAPPAVQVPESELDKKVKGAPIWKKWWFWTAIGGGTLVLGTGGYFLFRKPARA